MEKYDVNQTFQRNWGEGDRLFQKAFSVEGKVFREVKNRRTVQFQLEGKSYFIKSHGPVGWGEIWKNILQFKEPVIGSANEYQALKLLPLLGVHTMKPCVFAIRGTNPAAMESFLVTEDLVGMVSLEDFCRDWKNNPPPAKVKNQIIQALADTCGKMHGSGLNHRDCYICHFLLDPNVLAAGRCELHVIDLHRSQLRAKIPERFRIKDLAGIFFSSMDLGLSRKDALRFVAVYQKQAKIYDPPMWRKVVRTAVKLYRKVHKREPELPAGC